MQLRGRSLEMTKALDSYWSSWGRDQGKIQGRQ